MAAISHGKRAESGFFGPQRRCVEEVIELLTGAAQERPRRTYGPVQGRLRLPDVCPRCAPPSKLGGDLLLIEQREVDRVAHLAIAAIARMQAIAAIVGRSH